MKQGCYQAPGHTFLDPLQIISEGADFTNQAPIMEPGWIGPKPGASTCYLQYLSDSGLTTLKFQYCYECIWRQLVVS